jgi:hypothetical protein
MELSTGELIALVLSSSLLSALLSAVAGHLLAAKQYERDYHRDIIRRRLDSYETVHRVIGMLRGASYDNEGRTAHMVFAGGPETLAEAHKAVAIAMAQSIWYEPKVRDHLVALNRLLITVPHDGSQVEIFNAGVAIYQDVGRLREQLEAEAAANLRSLHDVSAFLKRKEQVAAKDPGPRIERVPGIKRSEA